ncbi:hypothetical protein DMC47_03685 [Nostoc sp. 3335mG]|nr:hypothetical protein DMC47_03685 [Nostoc sp. 3335mG]
MWKRRRASRNSSSGPGCASASPCPMIPPVSADAAAVRHRAISRQRRQTQGASSPNWRDACPRSAGRCCSMSAASIVVSRKSRPGGIGQGAAASWCCGLRCPSSPRISGFPRRPVGRTGAGSGTGSPQDPPCSSRTNLNDVRFGNVGRGGRGDNVRPPLSGISGMPGKIVAVQYLRAVAAILVLASHALLYPLAGENMAYGRLGWLGVILFFVISGFIMVSVTEAGRFDGRTFLRRRVLRVVPLYWAFTFVAAGLALVAPHLFKTTTFDGGELALSLIFIPFYNAASHGLHPLYKLGWTLNYEMFFYASFALLAMVSARRRVLGLSLLYAALALLGFLLSPQGAIPQFYTSFLPLAFIAGCWIGLAHLEGQIRNLPRVVFVMLAALGLAGLCEGFGWNRGLVEDASAFAGLLAFSGALLTIALRYEARLPHLGWLERLGNASYSIYLVHIFAVALLAGIGLRLLGPDLPGAVQTVTALAIAGGLALGLMLYRFVELPLMRKLRRA